MIYPKDFIETLPMTTEDEVLLRPKTLEMSRNDPQFSSQDLEKYQLFLKWLESEKNYDSFEKSVETLKQPEVEPKPEVLEKVQEEIHTELRVPEVQHRRSVSPIEQRLDTVEQELKAFSLEKSDEEFLDVIDDDTDDNSITVSEPTASTIIENPNWTSQMLEKIETLAESLTKTPLGGESEEVGSLVTVEPSVVFKENDVASHALTDINLPKNIQIGPKTIHLEEQEEEGALSDNPASDEEIVIESKLTISNTHVELTTLKTSSSQNSLNKIGSRRSSLTGSHSNLTLDSNTSTPVSKTSSLTNISDHDRTNDKPMMSHGKGKAPPVPPVLAPRTSPESSKPPLPMRPPVDRAVKEKKRKSGGGLFSSFTGIFKSDHNKDSDSHDESPKETRI